MRVARFLKSIGSQVNIIYRGVVLPYVSHIGMCHPKGWSLRSFGLKMAIDLAHFGLEYMLDYQPLLGKMSPHSSPRRMRGSTTGPGRRRKCSVGLESSMVFEGTTEVYAYLSLQFQMIKDQRQYGQIRNGFSAGSFCWRS